MTNGGFSVYVLVDGGEFQHDGHTTYCWGVNVSVDATDLTGQEVFIDGVGSQCPLQLRVIAAQPSEGGGTAVSTSSINTTAQWTVTVNETSASVFPARANASAGSTTLYSSLFVCEADAPCNPLLTDISTSADIATPEQIIQANLVNGKETAFQAELALTSPRNYSLMARVILVSSINASQRFDFAAYLSLAIAEKGDETPASVPDNQVASAPTTSLTEHPSGISSSLLVGIAVLSAVMMLVVGTIMTVVVRRESGRLQAERQPNGNDKLTPCSPMTGESNVRLSNWTEVYANHDDLPPPILHDDPNTASHASLQSPHRQVADFTHEVALWDTRPSASPITPMSSIFSSRNGDENGDGLASPTDGFVSMGSFGRCSGPLRERPHASSDSEEEQEIEV
ncbi:hypothetical protein BBJ28_00009467 [Nothophytophthora sp. Chile5]|nr:hypothetical protein BBJ28_00009467 [Nothophytophthora sp. Chile5]